MSQVEAPVQLLWSLGTVIVASLVWLIAARFEFDRRFESRTYGLRPTDLDDDAYASVLADAQLVPIKAVHRYRLSYSLFSALSVVVIAGFVACIPSAMLVLQKVTPPFIFSTFIQLAMHGAQAREHYRAETVFWLSIFTSGLLHGPELLILVLAPTDSKAAKTSMLPEHSLLRVLVACLFVQEYLLDRMIGGLLRQRYDDVERLRASAVHGSSAEMVKGAIAAEIARECDKALLDEQYDLLLKSPISSIGAGAARARGSTSNEITAHAKVIALIGALGIPDVRARLKWRTIRASRRRLANQGLSARLSNPCLSTIRIEDAPLRNVGGPRGRRYWNSFMIRVTVPSSPADIREGDRLDVTRIGTKLFSPEPLRCRVERVGRDPGSDCLFLGCVIDGHERRRFNRAVKLS